MGNPVAANKDRGKTFPSGGGGGGGKSAPANDGIPDFSSFEETQAYFKAHPELAKDPKSIGRVLAHAPLDVQKEAVDDFADQGKAHGILKEAIHQERREAFQQGKNLPGVTDAGSGLGNREQTATAVAGRAAYDQHEIAQGVSKNVGDYSYTPTPEKDVGWRPGDRYTDLGEAGHEQVDLLDKPIDYERTDTMGIDAQKALLGTYQDLYKQGGLDSIDRGRIAQSQAQRGVEYRGNIGAAAANAEEQGRFGGNAQLLSSLKAADTQSRGRRMDDLETSALGLQRRNQLLQQQGQVAGDIQTGVDTIGMFNATGERDRAMANQRAANAGHSDEYAAQEARDRQNNAQKNHGTDVAFGYEADKNRHAADAATEAKRFNVGPTQGERGITSDTLGAQGPATQSAFQLGGMQIGVQGHHDDMDAQERALYASVPAQIATLGTSFYKK